MKHRNVSKEYTYEEIRDIISRIEVGDEFDTIAQAHKRTVPAIKTFYHRWKNFKNGETANMREALKGMFVRYKQEHPLVNEPTPSERKAYRSSRRGKKRNRYSFIPLVIIVLAIIAANNAAWTYFFMKKSEPKVAVKEKVVEKCAWFSPVEADAYRACNGKIATYKSEYQDAASNFTCK